MLKRAQFYYRHPCTVCDEIKSFLAENGVLVSARDITQKPLRQSELAEILGYHNPRHYLDSASATFKKERLDKQMPTREELFLLIEAQPDLLKHPIVVTGRLMSVGTNRRQLIDMLQLKVSDNGSGQGDAKATDKGA